MRCLVFFFFLPSRGSCRKRARIAGDRRRRGEGGKRGNEITLGERARFGRRVPRFARGTNIAGTRLIVGMRVRRVSSRNSASFSSEISGWTRNRTILDAKTSGIRKEGFAKTAHENNNAAIKRRRYNRVYCKVSLVYMTLNFHLKWNNLNYLIIWTNYLNYNEIYRSAKSEILDDFNYRYIIIEIKAIMENY